MFMSDLSIIVRHMRVYTERTLKESGLGFPELLVVMYLMSRETSNQQQIADALGIDQGAIAKTINKLESKELIRREVNPNNKREKLLSLTPAADGLREKFIDAYHAWTQQIFAGVDDAQREQLEKTIALMAQNSAILIGKDE